MSQILFIYKDAYNVFIIIKHLKMSIKVYFLFFFSGYPSDDWGAAGRILG